MSRKQGIVSFCIFGNHPRYSIGAVEQAKLYNEYSVNGPVEWRSYFYCSPSVSNQTRFDLIRNGGVIIEVDRPEDQTATFWRFDAFSLEADYYLIRDTDSRLCPREIAATNEWINSGKYYHLMRDHPYHGVPVLAGLWGATAAVASEIKDVLPVVPPIDFYKEVNRQVNHTYYQSNDFYQVDQWWLRLFLFRKMRRKTFAHDEFFSFDHKREKHPFPTPRSPGEFVGKGWEADGTERHPEHSLLVY